MTTVWEEYGFSNFPTGWLAHIEMALALTVFVILNGCQQERAVEQSVILPNGQTSARPAEGQASDDGATNAISHSSPLPASSAMGRGLYLRHCASCHGETGDGQGIVAVYLHPKPRNFRAGRFRLVSTTNRMPTRRDLGAVLVRGMPGSAMPPFAHLDEQARELLVEEVLRLRQEGIRDQIVFEILRNDEARLEELDQQELDRLVAQRIAPGPATHVPPIHLPDADAVDRGKTLYFKQSCHACHGDTGKGDGKKEMVDDDGLPTLPRDFTRGIFKGDPDPDALFRRIAYGLPGTPMPSSRETLPSEEIRDLVHYIRSLSDETDRERAILRRERIVAKWVDAVSSRPDAPQWETIPAVPLRMTPMWWRHGADPDLEIQALHDGRSIAIRLAWQDDTEDRSTNASGASDGAALEIYRGNAEPFIGMGSFGSHVAVWFWTAQDGSSSERIRAKEKDVDPAAINSFPTDSELSELAHEFAGVGGQPFRMPRSDTVHMQQQWSNGQWTVVMTRPLATGNELFSVALEPGCQASIAFAIWNASEGDRTDRKSISVWQDLFLEDVAP